MSQRFVTFATAGDFSYCGTPGDCAKCKFRFFRDFITPIEQAYGETPPDLALMPLEQFMRLRGWREHLVAEMMTLPISDFTKLTCWVDHLRMAFYFIHDAELETSLLRQWLSTFDDDAPFAEVVVSSLIRHHHDADVYDAWTSKADSLTHQHK